MNASDLRDVKLFISFRHATPPRDGESGIEALGPWFPSVGLEVVNPYVVHVNDLSRYNQLLRMSGGLKEGIPITNRQEYEVRRDGIAKCTHFMAVLNSTYTDGGMEIVQAFQRLHNHQSIKILLLCHREELLQVSPTVRGMAEAHNTPIYVFQTANQLGELVEKWLLELI